VKAFQFPKGGLEGQKLQGGEAMATLVQRIICSDSVLEFEVPLSPAAWYRGPYPTSIRVVGDISEDTLRELIEYVESHGPWSWDHILGKFFPTYYEGT
jgi:hypothetical protein